MRHDLDVHPLRGNVDTRVRKLESGDYAAIILASAGLRRLGLTTHLQQMIPIEQMCPAAGQGALAIEIRAGDSATQDAIAFMDDAAARVATVAERAALNALGGGCQVPIGAHAVAEGNALTLHAVVARPDGSEILRDTQQGSANSAEALGASVGKKLLALGAEKILKDVYAKPVTPPAES
jgi:hydroxymethylbilane synthase